MWAGVARSSSDAIDESGESGGVDMMPELLVVLARWLSVFKEVDWLWYKDKYPCLKLKS